MVVVMMVVTVVVIAYRQSPTRKYLLAWLSSEPGLSACGILYRTRGFRIRVSMTERTNKKRLLFFFSSSFSFSFFLSAFSTQLGDKRSRLRAVVRGAVRIRSRREGGGERGLVWQVAESEEIL